MSEFRQKRSIIAQILPLLVGLALIGVGLRGHLAGYQFELASFEVTVIYGVLLILAPVCWVAGKNSRINVWKLWNWLSPPHAEEQFSHGKRSWCLACLVGLISLGASYSVSVKMEADGQTLPPAYHDEQSYLLQAETFLSGELSLPSHPTFPRLFDQIHVVNEGRFASRYFLGTGVWMMPFVALGCPYLGHWLAGALAAMLIFWSGRELGGDGVGLVAGMLTALSPGAALFSNLLLAHHPTLLGLAFFLYFFLRMQRTWHWGAALAAGSGLAFAMLCRPMTAAGVGLPFGLWFGWWLIRGEADFGFRFKRAAAMGLPIVVGLVLLLPFNRAITGDSFTTPYSLFTNTYTPRHVYGFENVTRGEEKIAAGAALTNDVFENYDRWAKDLTPALAAENGLIRTITSLQWTMGLLPLVMGVVVFVFAAERCDRRWWLILASIVTLHAVHIPYWFVGIMGWHYVFESCLLLCLLFAGTSGILFRQWQELKRNWMPIWWAGLIGFVLLSNWASFAPFGPTRLEQGTSEVMFARMKYARFHDLLRRETLGTKTLVLVEHDPADVSLDYVANHSGWDADLLVGRYRPGRTDVEDVLRLFPERACYLYRVKQQELIRLEEFHQ